VEIKLKMLFIWLLVGISIGAAMGIDAGTEGIGAGCKFVRDGVADRRI
jgi:hypothetical protein